MKSYKTKTYLIASDFQCPYHDPEAVEIACQIGEELRGTPTELSLVLNGDFLDFQQLGMFPSHTPENLRESVEKGNALLTQITDRIKPNGRRVWLDGNHEARLLLLMLRQPQIAQVLSLSGVAKAVAIERIMKLPERKIEYIGGYGYGTWLPEDDSSADRSRSIYVEHGNFVSAKAGYSVHRHGARNMISTVIGHCHRLGVVWHTVPDVGGQVQDYLFAEGGTMSLLGVPGKGDNLYISVPHRNPQIMNTQQGFLVLTLDEGNWAAEAVKITRGTAFFRGRSYRAVAKKRGARA